MSIYSHLKEDHREIMSLMDKIEQIGFEEPKERNTLFNELKDKLINHSKAEEKAFYQPLKQFRLTKGEVKHGEHEHEEAEHLLDQLTNPKLVGAAWFQKFKTLKSEVEHHINEEENEIFPDAKKILNKSTSNMMEEAMGILKNKQENNLDIESRDRS